MFRNVPLFRLENCLYFRFKLVGVFFFFWWLKVYKYCVLASRIHNKRQALKYHCMFWNFKSLEHTRSWKILQLKKKYNMHFAIHYRHLCIFTPIIHTMVKNCFIFVTWWLYYSDQISELNCLKLRCNILASAYLVNTKFI